MKKQILLDNLEQLETKEYTKLTPILVPENWEDLKELCKELKGNKRDCGGAMWFEFGVLNDSKIWLGKALAVDQKGQVGLVEQTWKEDNFSITIFAQNRTPAQMWNIIMALLGE